MTKVYAPGDDDMQEYPRWICEACGMKHQQGRRGVSSICLGICGWCDKETGVTEPRDYGFPKWEKREE
jgi:hypothetical protein